MTYRRNDMFTNWNVDKMTLIKWHIDKMTKWCNDEMSKWQNDEMSKWQNVVIMKYETKETDIMMSS